MADRTYAHTTKVPVNQTKGDIEKLVKQHGATAFGILENVGQVQVVFAMNGRNILFKVAEPEIEQERRARWRCLLLSIKSKLESAKVGIETFEEAFLAHTVMPNGQTVGQVTLPKIEQQYAGNDVPLLPDMRSTAGA